AGGTANYVEHFKDRHAAPDELRKRAGKTRHCDFVHKRSEDRKLQFPAIAHLPAASRAQEGATAEDAAANPEHEEIPLGAHKIAQVDQELGGRRQLRAEILEDFAEDRHYPHDEEGGN